ncbi:carboxyl-terminal processing protease CtpB [Spirulina subsalsa]|uniref:carboxyl-terminal processing protease CtpB n=1 Tax=Spirulina subsalsa TaxID=54311 RepID=UPI0003060D5B|nr:carboxyl-terminal processing protease CtpB [Spirulina subsalsa]
MNYQAKLRSQFTRLSSRLLTYGALATLVATSVVTVGLTSTVKAALEDSPKIVIDEVWQIVNNEFVGRNFDQAAWQRKRQELLSRDYSSQGEAYKAIRQALRDLGDPYTRFLDPKEFEELTSQTTGELSGIGVRLTLDEKTNALTVVDPVDNSPAKAAGIQAGDRILQIDGQSTALMSVEQASELIRGEQGTDITLQLNRPGRGLFEVTLTRAQVEVPVLHSSLKQEGEVKVGYLKLDEFSSHAAEQMRKAIDRLEGEGVNAFVLDLRGNPGGLLFSSVDIARMWMETGTIVRTVDRKGGDRAYSANRTAITNLPLVVLVDGYSASASEILAGALKDNGRAVIVGSRTFGKGTVQSVHSLSDRSGLAVTISRYYPPSGVNISQNGITPDVPLDLTGDQVRLLRSNPSFWGTSRDPQYRQAISVLQSNVGRKPVLPPSLLPAPLSSRQDGKPAID